MLKSCTVESDEDEKCTRGSVDKGENNREVKPTSGSCVDSRDGSFVDSGGNNCEIKLHHVWILYKQERE